ncbi:MAG TPA: DUF72 domain-containing protein [Candidatus Acidoferrales bacterium]|nr:DUF72 domain-containing protein [Candidatus Acidoferrales bacterium]
MKIYIGTAGWAIPRKFASRLPTRGRHLECYANVLPAVEINTTFYRSHRPETYQRWATSVPESFRFAVKAPRQITHFARLANARKPLVELLAEAGNLGPKLGPILFQLPPNLKFDTLRAERFFRLFRKLYRGDAVCEPRHPGWFMPEADQVFRKYRIARVVADPARVPEGSEPGGWQKLVYFRLHGSPQMYFSAYDAGFLDRLAYRIRSLARSAHVWCIFDNTAAGAAIGNALDLLGVLLPI